MKMCYKYLRGSLDMSSGKTIVFRLGYCRQKHKKKWKKLLFHSEANSGYYINHYQGNLLPKWLIPNPVEFPLVYSNVND